MTKIIVLLLFIITLSVYAKTTTPKCTFIKEKNIIEITLDKTVFTGSLSEMANSSLIIKSCSLKTIASLNFIIVDYWAKHEGTKTTSTDNIKEILLLNDTDHAVISTFAQEFNINARNLEWQINKNEIQLKISDKNKKLKTTPLVYKFDQDKKNFIMDFANTLPKN